MTFPFVEFGDAEALVIDILKNAPEVSAFSPTISTDLRGFSAGSRWIEIILQGGSYPWPKPRHPRVDITCLAESRAVAHDMIQACSAVMFREQNNHTAFGLHYIACSVESDLFRSTEKDTDQTRYVLAFRIVVTPDPSTLPAQGQ